MEHNINFIIWNLRRHRNIILFSCRHFQLHSILTSQVNKGKQANVLSVMQHSVSTYDLSEFSNNQFLDWKQRFFFLTCKIWLIARIFLPFCSFCNLDIEWSVGRSDDWELLCFICPPILGDEVRQGSHPHWDAGRQANARFGRGRSGGAYDRAVSLSHSGLSLVLFPGNPENKVLLQHQQTCKGQRIQDGKHMQKDTFLQRALLMRFAPHSCRCATLFLNAPQSTP